MRLNLSVILIFSLSITACDSNWFSNWRQKQLEKRYGAENINRDNIEEWGEDLAEYREEALKKIKAGEQTGRLYRRIGESYAKIQSFELCTENLEQAVRFGSTDAETFAWLGSCYANLAKTHNWQFEYAGKAEKNLLKSLNLNPDQSGPLFQLALVYFYGMGSNNRYRVLDDYITVKQSDYRSKAIELLQRSQNLEPERSRSYFALAGMYRLTGKDGAAAAQMRRLTAMLKELYPDSYAGREEYINAVKNLQELSP